MEKCRLLMQDLSFKNQFPGSITVPGVRYYEAKISHFRVRIRFRIYQKWFSESSRSALGLDRHSSSPSPVGSSVVSSLNSDITYSQWNSAHGYLPGSRNEHMMDPDGWHGIFCVWEITRLSRQIPKIPHFSCTYNQVKGWRKYTGAPLGRELWRYANGAQMIKSYESSWNCSKTREDIPGQPPSPYSAYKSV